MDVVEDFLFYIITTKLSNLHCTWGLYEVHNFLMIRKIKLTCEAVYSRCCPRGGLSWDLKVLHSNPSLPSASLVPRLLLMEEPGYEASQVHP